MSDSGLGSGHARVVRRLRSWRLNQSGNFEDALDGIYQERIERLREAIWILEMQAYRAGLAQAQEVARMRELLEVSE